MDRGAWWATIHGAARETDMTKKLNDNNNELLTWTHKNNSGYLSHLKVLNLKHICFFHVR